MIVTLLIAKIPKRLKTTKNGYSFCCFVLYLVLTAKKMLPFMAEGGLHGDYAGGVLCGKSFEDSGVKLQRYGLWQQRLKEFFARRND